MQKALCVAGWSGFSILIWWLLGFWLPSGSERFYLLLIPLSLVLTGLLSPRGWWAAWEQTRRAACSFLAVGLGCAVLGFLLAVRLDLPINGIWPQVVWFSYFATSVCFLLLALYGGLQWVLQRSLPRPDMAGDGSTTPGTWRPVAVKLVAALVLAVFAVPYLMAVFFVHRVKLPNTDAPEVRLGRPVEKIAFQTEDGLTLQGWFIPCRDATSTRTLIICHGIGVNRTLFLPFVRFGDELNAHVVMFDFRGHGESDGHTSSLGYFEKLDVLAAIKYVRTQKTAQAKELVALGVSLGAACLAHGAAEAEPPLDAVILDSSFASAMDLTDSVLRLFPDFARPPMMALGMPLASLHAGCWLPDVQPMTSVAHLRCPVLIIHPREDEMIPPDQAHKLFANACEPKLLWITATEGHGSALSAFPEYLQHVHELMALRPNSPSATADP